MGLAEYYRDKYGVGAQKTTKHWWEEELEALDGWDETAYQGRSVSSTREVLGYHSWGERTYGGGRGVENKVEAALNKVSAEIVRLMNTVRNSEQGKQERTLSIAWGKQGDKSTSQNNPLSDTVTLSPDLIVTNDGRNDKSDDPAVIDGIGGQALMGSTLKRTMNTNAFNMAMTDTSPLSKHTKIMWQAAETAKAKQEIVREWPGFAPYLKRHQTLTTSKQDEVQQFVDSKPDKLSAAVAAAAWTLANPNAPLKLPANMEQAVAKVAEQLNQSDSTSRYIAAKNTVEYLRTIFEDDEEKKQDPNSGQPPPPQQPPPGQGKGQGQGKGKDDKNQPPPKITDGSLFGDGVPSTHKDAPAPTEVGNNTTGLEHAEMPVGCARLKGARYERVRTGLKANYNIIVKQAAPLIRAITGAINFRRTAAEFPLHGLRSGDLDDGSLDKLALRERNPAVFQRNEVTAIPDVAIALLVDESGSMNSRYESARLVCVSLYESFRKLRGLNIMVMGFDHSQRNEKFDMREYYGPNQSDHTAIAGINAGGYTPLSYAVEETIKRLACAYPQCRQKYVFVMTDGRPDVVFKNPGDPCPQAYGGEPAMRHNRNVCEWGRKRFGIQTYGIGIDGKPDQRDGEYMFGQQHYICLKDTIGSARVVASFLSRVTSKV